MRGILGLAAVVLGCSGCASTVFRMAGEPVTPGGPAETPCESADWLVIAPTRAEVANPAKGTSYPKRGLGLYRVGSDSPEDLTAVEGLDSPSIARKREEVSPYDTRQIVAGSLGAAGVIAIAVGTILFVNAFETKTVPNNTVAGGTHEENTVNGTKAGLGGGFVGLGFGLGIAGLVVNPTNAERTQTRATRKVFFDPPDDPKSVEKLVGEHNAHVRQVCSAH